VSHERVVVLSMMIANGLALGLMERLLHRRSHPTLDEGAPHLRANLALTGLLIALNFAFDRIVAVAGIAPRGDAFGLFRGWPLPEWARVVVVVVVLDGLAYVAHLLMHQAAPAWRFHRVHHSDPHVDVTTAFRQHPLETVWRYSFLLAGALLLGASSVSVAVYLALSALMAQLEHAHVVLPPRLDRSVRLLFSSPAMHRVHHSRRQPETDTNYSNIFSFWDRLFGTYRPPRDGESIACGLDDLDDPEHQRTAGLLALPFGS